ncbi:hypothetical protein LSH36_102g02056 [Paralvinella palmiformis]|uniref:pyrroline-5-carboxylate reductase n=1 Tax=Paralvinella palmiformis TaxID=53620 RepID=A0AAD9K0J9_9ANNE|nr:hypothetical protein LSH36_102g02056 [Paralvinella palmiformis]
MKVGFIGAGKMAKALCQGFISTGLINKSEILASDINPSKLKEISRLGVQTTSCNREVVKKNDIVYVAVKPPLVREVLREVSPVVNPSNLFVSIAAGITTKTMEEVLPKGCRVIRVMPNIAVVVQAGACAYTPGTSAKNEDVEVVTQMLTCVGSVEEIPEELMDTVTGLSGNGPAYGFITIQGLADGGVKMGLNREQSTRLAAQLLLGAAKMVLGIDSHPEQMKDEVCSPGGTSIHALHKLEKSGFRAALVDAVEAGTLRSKELGKLFNKTAD